VAQAKPQRERTAAIVVIGDEILSGKTADTNSPFLLRELRELGVAVRQIHVIPDIEEEIVEAIQRVGPRVDFVFTSGGVGPTHDDVTIAAIARAKGRPLVRHPQLVEMIQGWHGGNAPPIVLRMADVPDGTELLYAAGLRFPLLVLENIYILPGIPEIFREKFLAVRERFRCDPFHLRRIYSSEGEGHLAPFMSKIVRDFPSVSVGSYPTITALDYRVQVTLESKDRDMLDAACAAFRALVGEAAIVRVE
jgi:molybdenum cofactor synthesis domain-containing protein